MTKGEQQTVQLLGWAILIFLVGMLVVVLR